MEEGESNRNWKHEEQWVLRSRKGIGHIQREHMRRHTGENEVKLRRLKCSFVQQFVDSMADLPEVESALVSVPVQL